MRSNVTFYPQDTEDKSRHQWIRLAAASISRKMDNWTLLSAGFDVGEETNGGSRTSAKPQEGTGSEEGGREGEMKMCMHAREMSEDWPR